jgi:hypothetical protein
MPNYKNQLQKERLKNQEETRIKDLLYEYLGNIQSGDRELQGEDFLAMSADPIPVEDVLYTINQTIRDNPETYPSPEDKDNLNLAVWVDTLYDLASGEQMAKWKEHLKDKEPLESL